MSHRLEKFIALLVLDPDKRTRYSANPERELEAADLTGVRGVQRLKRPLEEICMLLSPQKASGIPTREPDGWPVGHRFEKFIALLALDPAKRTRYLANPEKELEASDLTEVRGVERLRCPLERIWEVLPPQRDFNKLPAEEPDGWSTESVGSGLERPCS